MHMFYKLERKKSFAFLLKGKAADGYSQNLKLQFLFYSWILSFLFFPPFFPLFLILYYYVQCVSIRAAK